MAAGYHVVARFAKPHGLKGESVVFVLTDRPEDVFQPGRELTPVDDAGRPVGGPLTIERARPYHRRWLVKFREVDDRTILEQLARVGLGVPPEAWELSPNELLPHEVPGLRVVVGQRAVGVAKELIPVPGGQLLAMEREGREVLIPFRPPILVRVDRARREIEIDPPLGLLEL